MIGVLTRFVGELRQVGIPVSMVEAIDAARAIEQVSMEDRQALRHSLAACLVKNSHHLAAFDTAFDVFANWYHGVLEASLNHRGRVVALSEGAGRGSRFVVTLRPG